jgi:hypothetical protein
VAAPILEDAELQWDLRRWFVGDPEPWPGAGTGWRNGTLFVGIVDKSGFREGTSIGGNLLLGLTRTIADVLSNHVEDSYDLFTGERSTNRVLPAAGHPRHPAFAPVCGLSGRRHHRHPNVGVRASPGGPGRITVGGLSMPGVNELISAAIQYGGDVLGDNISAAISFGAGFTVSVGSLGGALDSFLNPIYRDSDPRAHQRAAAAARLPTGLGPLPGNHLDERDAGVHRRIHHGPAPTAPGNRPDLAFTSPSPRLRRGLIGDNGFGHWWLGDRVGGTSKYLMPRVFVRRCRNLDISWGDGKGVDIQATFGDTRNDMDALERMAGLIGKR